MASVPHSYKGFGVDLVGKGENPAGVVTEVPCETLVNGKMMQPWWWVEPAPSPEEGRGRVHNRPRGKG